MSGINFERLCVIVAKTKWTDDDLETVEKTLTENPEFCSKRLKDNFCAKCYKWNTQLKCTHVGCYEVSPS